MPVHAVTGASGQLGRLAVEELLAHGVSVVDVGACSTPTTRPTPLAGDHQDTERPVEPLAGKVVIDTNNSYADRDGPITELDDGSTTSSELLQAHLPSSHVVTVFNNVFFRHLATLGRPHGAPTAAPWPSSATTRRPRRR